MTEVARVGRGYTRLTVSAYPEELFKNERGDRQRA
jgi:hypothetical protein